MEARFIKTGNLIKGKAAELFIRLGLAEKLELEEKVEKRVKPPAELASKKPVKKRKKRKTTKK